MHRDRRVAVGVEVGSRKTIIALIDHHGRVMQRSYAKTLRGRPATATLEPYVRAIDDMLTVARADGWSLCGISVSIPGTLDAAQRRPLNVSLLPSLNGFPLCDYLETRYHLPAQLLVDVDAALLGEHHFGVGKGRQRLLFLAVNAVVGASLVVDGQLERSTQGYMGHICHLSVATSGPRCSCGKRGCINTLVSMDAMQKRVLRALRRGDETSLARRLLNHEYFSAQLLAEEAERGDSVALQVYSDLGRWMGNAILQYIGLFEPEMLILNGAVLGAGDLLLARLRSILAHQALSGEGQSGVEIVPARLGSDAALIGAVVPHFDLPSRAVMKACI
jgi:glucokinase